MDLLLVSEMLALLAESMELVIIVDKNAKIVFITDVYCNIFGFNRQELLGKHVCEVLPTSRLPYILKSGIMERGNLFYAEHAVLPEYKNKYFVCNLVPLYKDGVLVGAYASSLLNAISELGKFEEHVDEMDKKIAKYRNELKAIRSQVYSLDRVVGDSPGIAKTKELVGHFASTSLPVLLMGETGTGKEVWANAIYQNSCRSDQPYVKVNCAALPRDLLESELFGYEPGAFTGALKSGKRGKFELANHGTILLDEISEMPIELQAKLLRILQEKELEKIGSAKTIPLDVRVICSTNQNLAQMVREKRFREDLLYRINTVEIELPPLKNRLEDLPALCDFFLHKINEAHGIHILELSADVLNLFRRYHWPGNIRELEHVLERACLAKLRGYLEISSFDFLLSRAINSDAGGHRNMISNQRTSLKEKKVGIECEEICHALKLENGNKAAAARYLQMDRGLLYRKMKKYHLE